MEITEKIQKISKVPHGVLGTRNENSKKKIPKYEKILKVKSQIPDSTSAPNILSDCLDQLNATLSIFCVIDGTVTSRDSRPCPKVNVAWIVLILDFWDLQEL